MIKAQKEIARQNVVLLDLIYDLLNENDNSIFDKEIKGKYNVVAIVDDRLSVSKMWHDRGLPLFRVGDPLSDF